MSTLPLPRPQGCCLHPHFPHFYLLLTDILGGTKNFMAGIKVRVTLGEVRSILLVPGISPDLVPHLVPDPVLDLVPDLIPNLVPVTDLVKVPDPVPVPVPDLAQFQIQFQFQIWFLLQFQI